jgi:eukaryotic-like serine/threonine-protein kinase
VPNVVGRTLPRARHALVAAHCQLGRVTYAFSRARKKGRVLSQRPKPNAQLPSGGRVRVVVSKGRRR